MRDEAQGEEGMILSKAQEDFLNICWKIKVVNIMPQAAKLGIPEAEVRKYVAAKGLTIEDGGFVFEGSRKGKEEGMSSTVDTMTEEINQYLEGKAKRPQDVVEVLQRLLDHHSKGDPMGPLSRWIMGRVTDKLRESVVKHKKLSQQFEKLKPLCAAEKVRGQMGALCREMQNAWEPFQEFIGACPHCHSPRIAGTTNGFDGFGCPRCGEMEKISEAKGKGKG